MKLGELKGERAIEVIADLIAPIANIAEDQKNLKLFMPEKKDGETERETAVREFKEKIPMLLKTHKADVLSILSTLNDVDPKDLSLLDIIKGLVELVDDQDFLSLFLSAVGTGEKTSPTKSSPSADHSKPE